VEKIAGLGAADRESALNLLLIIAGLRDPATFCTTSLSH
jgi:hypothetical protein